MKKRTAPPLFAFTGVARSRRERPIKRPPLPLSRKKNPFDLMPDYSSRKRVRNPLTPESAINPISTMKSGRKVRGRKKAKIPSWRTKNLRGNDRL